MTVNSPATTQAPSDHVVMTVDGHPIAVPKGTLILRAAELLGIEIPKFCDHPLLAPVAACRACLVEVEGQAKPQPACAIPVSEGMAVKTACTSALADKAQKGVLEFLLINHPLDCPVCDKGGECPLQNQAMSHGHSTSRFTGTKRTFPKPVALSTQILLDRERCVSCARCTRFAAQIAGDPFISLQQRGAKQIVGIAEGVPFDSYFSGNTVQICPVGALTSAAYRFRSRPFDLVSTPTVCEHCAAGCALRTDVRRTTVMRRLAWEDAAVNEDWNCDKGRFAFPYLSSDRLSVPQRRVNGDLVDSAWADALAAAADALTAAGSRTAVVLGGRLSLEDAYAYSRFARAALGTDNIDFRARRTSTEEADFLRGEISGSGIGITYADLDRAPAVLLVGLEPEEESPAIFLRLRKTTLAHSKDVYTVAPLASAGSAKLGAHVLVAVPGQEPSVIEALGSVVDGPGAQAFAALKSPGAVILVGERAAQTPGTLSAATSLSWATGARLAWVPRRAGERGALEAGALPGLLPWGRPLNDAVAREQVAQAWKIDSDALPTEPGMDLPAVIAAVSAHRTVVADDQTAQAPIEALIIAGVDFNDLPDPDGFLAFLDRVPFVIALDTRSTAVTARADVVLPVGVITEHAGTFINWEGRARPFASVIKGASSLTDARLLELIAQKMGRPAGLSDVVDLRREIAGLGRWQGPRPAVEPVAADPQTPESIPGVGQALLATWRHLLDEGVLQAGEAGLAGTARAAVVRLSQSTADSIAASPGDLVEVASSAGSLALPLEITKMPDGVVWLPTNSVGSNLNMVLKVGTGAIVGISAGGTK